MEQQEQAEWDDVNKLLQHHGFKPVSFADPVENKSFPDLILLDKKSAGEIRRTLRMMLADSDRRQSLIQELIRSNNQLKEEVLEHTGRAAQQSLKVTELEGLLDVVRTRVQDLEDRCLGNAVQRQSYTQQLQQEKQEAQEVCEALEQKLSTQREEAAQLHRKLYFTVKEEERRLARQSRTFQHICKRASRQDSPADQQVLDVIDFYETKMTQLLDELRSVKGEPEGRPSEKSPSSISPSFKSILKAYQDQMEELRREVERLKEELGRRPTLKEVKEYKHKLRRLEAKHSNTSENLSERSSYHRLLKEISAAVTNPSTPFRPHRQKPSVGSDPDQFNAILPTLEAWAQQLRLLKDLQKGLDQLTGRLMPWQPADGDHSDVRVEDMMLLVDTMLENTSTDDEKVLRSPTRFTLSSMVSHFQKLFDVASLSGVYPRMNDVYTKLEETANTMRNLRDVLQLDGRVPPAEVVNHVARLASAAERTRGLRDLLGDADIDSIVVKVKQHDEFFPAFHAFATDILHTLGVRHLDDVLPAVKSLKQMAQ